MCNYLQALAHLHSIIDYKVSLYSFQTLKLIISKSQLLKTNSLIIANKKLSRYFSCYSISSENSGHYFSKSERTLFISLIKLSFNYSGPLNQGKFSSAFSFFPQDDYKSKKKNSIRLHMNNLKNLVNFDPKSKPEIKQFMSHQKTIF